MSLSNSICSRLDSGQVDVCLFPGAYRIWKENSIGQFVVGDGGDLYFEVNDGRPPYVQRGGIWLPVDRSAPLGIFIIAGDSAVQVSSLKEAELKRKVVEVDLKKKDLVSDPATNPVLNKSMLPSQQRLSTVQSGLSTGVAWGIVQLMIGDELHPLILDTVRAPVFKASIAEAMKQGDKGSSQVER